MCPRFAEHGELVVLHMFATMNWQSASAEVLCHLPLRVNEAVEHTNRKAATLQGNIKLA